MGSTLSRCVQPGFELLKAARRGDVARLKSILARDPELLRYRSVLDEETVWHVAAAEGRVDVLAALAEAGLQGGVGREELREALNAYNDKGQTALMVAALCDKAPAVKWLLSQGADPFACDPLCRRTALHLAAHRGHVAAVEALTGQLATAELCRYLDARSISGMTPLHYACAANQAGVVRCLLARGADVAATTTADVGYDLLMLLPRSTPLHAAAAASGQEAAAELLRHYHTHLASPQFPDPRRKLDARGRSPHQVAAMRQAAVLAELLHPNADLGAVFGPGAADAEAATAGSRRAIGGGGAGVVPRLSYIAAAAVRRRLEADIEAAVQALCCGQAPERKAPSGTHPGTGTAAKNNATSATDTTSATTPAVPAATASTTPTPPESSLPASSPPAAPNPFLRESSPAFFTLHGRPSPALPHHPRSPLATLSATHPSTSSSSSHPHPYSRFARRSGGGRHPSNTTHTCTTAYARAPAPRLAPCVVCLEDEAPCLLLLPCRHRLCAGCARGVVRRVVSAPLPCPVCRETVEQMVSPEG